MERTNDENQIIKDQIKAFEEQINATKSSSYDFTAFPENYELQKKFGFKMKSDEFEFLKVAERLKNYINTKDTSTRLESLQIKGDTIQDMTLLYNNIVMLIFVATSGLVTLPDFDKLDENFTFLKGM